MQDNHQGMRNTGNGHMKIVYEDEWLIVVDKPHGLLTMSSGKAGEETAYSMLYEYVRNEGRGRNHRIFIIHRLDRDTSGLLVFAKDEETKSALQENWHEAVTERTYTAILEGNIEDEDGWIETWLYEHPKSLKVHSFPFRRGDDRNNPPRKGWKAASTHCRTTARGKIDGHPYTKVEFELETGRKNQIRVHSQWIGHPIAGDSKYGAQTDPLNRLALHAGTLSFVHPWTGNLMQFKSPVPKCFEKLK